MDAKDLPTSSGELGILFIAASLADAAARIQLGDAVSGLDTTNLALVLKAIAVADGRPEAR
ncbi:hypothetical protein [Streptomyces sp. NBC_01013]|uniref:hypothetical protein n=1 Tax=Streptomyces sp. NBC_01013 TaxID=2903718 RepID=UPI00386AED14|nr:hypothetical protein OG538_17495 [Streptomyces sp. NBC_01013]